MSPRVLYFTYITKSNTMNLINEVEERTSEDPYYISSSTSIASNTTYNEMTVLNNHRYLFLFDINVYHLNLTLIMEKIWLQSKLPCTWILKEDKIRADAIKLKGTCSQCSAEIQITTLNITNEIHTFLCCIHNLDKYFQHNPKKRTKLTPFKRRQRINDLTYKPPILVHNELVTTLMTCNESHLPNIEEQKLPSVSALRQVKSDAKLGQLSAANALTSLIMLTKVSGHENTIREILAHPNFHIYYWSDKQVDYYKMYFEKFKRVTITIDATESFFETIHHPNGTAVSKALFLYTGLTTANKKLKSFPIFSMVTDAHNTKSITDWLKNWQNNVVNMPHEIITNNSSALLSANIQVFTSHATVKNYISHLFLILEGKSTKLPGTFIRLDTCHFVQTVHNLSCFKKGIDKDMKYFYISCILLLKKCENYDVAKKVIEDVIEVCLGQYIDNRDEIFVTIAIAKKRLDNLLDDATAHLDSFQEFNIKEEIEEDVDLDSFENIDFMTWFDQIVESKKSIMMPRNKNLYSYPPFLSTLKILLYKMPLWSNLLCPFYKSENRSPSSSAAERYFNTLKKFIFKTKLYKYRIDQFIKISFEYLEEEIKIALCELKNKKSQTRKRSIKRKDRKSSLKEIQSTEHIAHHNFPIDSLFSDKLSSHLNCKGEIAEGDIDEQKETVKFLRNGNLCESVFICDKEVRLTNTCALDSAMYLLSLNYNQNKHTDTITDKNIQEFLKCLRDNDSSHDVLKLRSLIALQHFSKKQKAHKITIDCASNVTNIFESILLNYFSSAVSIKHCLTESCTSEKIIRNVVFLPLNLNIISVFGINALEDAVSLSDDNGTCLSCNGTASYSYELSNLISMDLNGTDKVNLDDVPKTILIKNKYYKLLGDVRYCDAYYDSFLCWGPTPAGQTAYQNCPPARLSDTSQLAFRVCGESGLWLGRRQNESSAAGWTNYTPCFPTEVKLLFDKVSEDENAQFKFEIARNTRYLEIIGFSISLIALLISLFIFSHYRSLRNNRTRIHKSLFSAMIVQVIIRLVVYIDQELIRSKLGDQSTAANATIHGIDNMPYLCEVSYVMLEYAITAMFFWMFIEGLYLNNLVTASTLRDNMSYKLYFAIGWGIPIVFTVIWATFTGLHYKKEEVKKCWYGYNFQPMYWIVQGPRLAVVVTNFIFLLNILRVLIVKLRKSENTEVSRVRKALRAAFVLLPLLGITNALDMTEAPLGGSVWRFAIWSYSTHFLRSFQGFFIALIYCFLNAEVRTVIRKHYDNYKAMRETRRRQRSLFRNNGFGTSLQEHRPSTSQTNRSRSEYTQTRIPLRPLRWTREERRLRYAETRISLPSIHENRCSTGTDTDLDVPRRASAFASLDDDIITVQEDRSNVMLQDNIYRRSDSRLPCPCQQENVKENETTI